MLWYALLGHVVYVRHGTTEDSTAWHIMAPLYACHAMPCHSIPHYAIHIWKYRKLYILFTMVSAQQTNLLPENVSFCPKSISDICDHFAILKFLWLHNHHSIYIYIYIYIYIPYCRRGTSLVKTCIYLIALKLKAMY